ncbi:iron-containing alcohol dehydrogenase [Erysipelothrix urinaevulpis]|uniref:iron-containing alcohol dehydrogenase n=1 Tax=Erysipelothrix urinaevulpis TaxID=2683717 RepID=UPI00135BFFC4|nr:iron-containing alcohol dehydrogenase [Erysipelothrix urinaevulpis]
MKELVLPAINKFGSGCISLLGEMAKEKKLKKALIITDENLNKLGVLNGVYTSLENHNIAYVVYDNVHPNPTITNVNEATALYHDYACDFIVGVGGGSPNDCSKAVGILASNGGDIKDYEGFNQSNHPAPLTFLVNTTAGTASEISRAYLISDPDKQEKLIFKDINALPYCSFNDADMMINLPASITASTGMDALTHAIESYVSVGAYRLTKELSLSAIKLVFENLVEACENGKNVEARDNMIYAQTLAGIAFANAGLGLVHSMAHALGGVYNLPHGLCNAILLPEVMVYNNKKVEAEYAEITDYLYPGLMMTTSEKAVYLIEKVNELSIRVKTKTPLNELGVSIDGLDILADKALEDGNLPRNPIQPTKKEILEIYERVY